MQDPIKVISLKNSTGIDLEIFLVDTQKVSFQDKDHKTICTDLSVPVCESYDPTGFPQDPSKSPNFLCIRHPNTDLGIWLRFFIDGSTGQPTSGKLCYISHKDNRWDARKAISTNLCWGLRPNGLYLEAKYTESPYANKSLWIVGELVTDLGGGGII